jgi:hypothetical protein
MNIHHYERFGSGGIIVLHNEIMKYLMSLKSVLRVLKPEKKKKQRKVNKNGR